EERVRSDWVAAQRHLGLALRLRPKDRSLASTFRRVASEAARSGAEARPPPPAAVPAAVVEEAAREPLDAEPMEHGVVEGSHEDELLVERLTDRLRANPADLDTAVSLADALTRLGRDLDLLALASARLEEGDERARAAFSPRRRDALAR